MRCSTAPILGVFLRCTADSAITAVVVVAAAAVDDVVCC
jgi:hypothetical protein